MEYLIPIKEGAKRFVSEFSNINSQVEVVIGSPIVKSVSDDTIKQLFVRIHKDSHPFIESHVIKGTPVLPIVFISEMCLKIAGNLYPNETVRHCKNMKVLKGITLKNYYENGDWLCITCTEQLKDKNKKLKFEVKGIDGIRHYSLDIVVGTEETTKHKNTKRKKEALNSWDWEKDSLYGHKLFHGVDFQVIKKLEGITDNKCCGILSQKPDIDTKFESWTTNFPVIDGGLQLALLWRYYHMQQKSLPTGFGEMIIYNPIKTNADITCDLEVVDSNDLYNRFNVMFYDEKGVFWLKLKN